METAQNDQAKIPLSEPLRVYARQQTERDVKIEAAVMMRHDISNIYRKLIKLMANGEYKYQVVDLLLKTPGKV